VRKLRGWVAALAAMVMAGGALSATPALSSQSEAAAQTVPPVINGPVFNDPTAPAGSSARRAVIDQLIRLFQSTTPDSEVHLAMHQWMVTENTSGEDVLSALTQARIRGAEIKVIIDSALAEHEETYDRLEIALGNDVTADSWVMRCPNNRGCIAGGPNVDGAGYLHNKFALFTNLSVDGTTYRNAVFQSSSNLHDWYINVSFNDAYTLATQSAGTPEDQIYNRYRDYFLDLQERAAGSPTDHYYQSYAAGKYRVGFYPHRKQTSATDDPVRQVLDRINGCEYPGPDGNRYVTRIDFALTHWTNYRTNIAEKVAELARRGCVITVIIGGELGTEVEAELRSVPTIDLIVCRRDGEKPHTKITMFKGPYNGTPTSRVITGSANFTQMPRSDDIELELVGEDTYARYWEWFGQLYSACTQLPSTSK